MIDLSAVPSALLAAELAKRRKYTRSCLCGTCQKCKNTARKARLRATQRLKAQTEANQCLN